MAAFAWVIGHGGTAGLVVEVSSAVAIGALLLWAAARSRRENEKDGPEAALRPPDPPER